MPDVVTNKQNAEIVALQDDLYLGLLSWDRIVAINVVQQRKMKLDNMASFETIYQTVRAGKAGMGILVEMPTFQMSANLSGPGPQTELLVSLLVLECPAINQVAQSGTETDAETVAELLLNFLHQFLVDGQGEMYPQDKPIQPANDVPPGTLGYRVMVKMQHAPVSIHRLTLPAQTIDENFLVTFDPLNTDVDADVEVYFTLDESPPCSANEAATKYDGNPVEVEVGQVLRWAAWATGYRPSTFGRAVVQP